MKRTCWFMLILAVGLAAGCGPREKTAIVIQDVRISPEEFEREFENSCYVRMPDKGRETYLDHLIEKKLILLEAERLGLDKDPKFMKDIQGYWEQGLLKRMINYQAGKMAALVQVSDQEVREFYEKYGQTEYAGKEFPEVDDEIRKFLIREKQSKAIGEWVAVLRKKAKIQIDYSLLGIEE